MYYVNVNCVEQNLTRCSINQQIPKAVLKDKAETQSSPITMADVTLLLATSCYISMHFHRT